MLPPFVPYISLCSGYEGIGIGLHRIIRGLRTVAYCEREAFACANLAAKIEAGCLDAAPVFTNVCSFPWFDFTEIMAGGILSFGWPCQPVSAAGQRKGTEDERWLFDIICDGIAVMRPGILFAENVEGLLSAKMPDGSLIFAHCITRLESLGYRVKAGLFSAAEIGAPHQRKRIFIMAHRRESRLEGFAGDGDRSGKPGWLASQPHRSACTSGIQLWPAGPGQPQYDWEPRRTVGNASQSSKHAGTERGGRETGPDLDWSGSGSGLDDSIRTERREVIGSAHEPDRQEGGWDKGASGSGESSEMGDTPRGDGLDTEETAGRESGRRFELTGENELAYVEHATNTGSSIGTPGQEGRPGQEQEPERSDGRDQGAVESPLGRDADGNPCRVDYAFLCESSDNRIDELRLCGNGVVPATAAKAFVVLWQRLNQQHRLAWLE